MPDRAPDFSTLVESRRSVHLFRPEVPPERLLAEAVALARWAPNHRLTEPWRFYRLAPETAEAVARLNAELVAARKGAEAGRQKLARWQAVPGWLVATCHLADDALRRREDYAACACAVQILMLALWREGVGTKWTTGPVTRHPRFYELIGVDPQAEEVVGLVWYGYPAEVPPPPPRRLGSDALLTTR